MSCSMSDSVSWDNLSIVPLLKKQGDLVRDCHWWLFAVRMSLRCGSSRSPSALTNLFSAVNLSMQLSTSKNALSPFCLREASTDSHALASSGNDSLCSQQ